MTESVTTDEFIAAAMRAGAQASSRDEAIRRIANLKPLAGQLVSEDTLKVLSRTLVLLVFTRLANLVLDTATAV